MYLSKQKATAEFLLPLYSVEVVDDVAGVKIVITQATKESLFEEASDATIDKESNDDNPKEVVEEIVEVVETKSEREIETTFEPKVEANSESKVDIMEATSETKVEADSESKVDIIEVNAEPIVVENEIVCDAKIEVIDASITEVQSEIQETSSTKSDVKEEAGVIAKIEQDAEITAEVQEDKVDAVNSNVS